MFGCIDAAVPFQRKDSRYFCVNAALRDVRGVVCPEFPSVGTESDDYCVVDLLSSFLRADKFFGVRLFTACFASRDNVG